MKRMLNELSLWIKWKIALWRASRALASRKREFPGCESAMNVWPTVPTTTLSAGIRADGITTLRWGTAGVVRAINGTTFADVSVAIVLRVNQKTIVDNIKLPNGDGVTSSRVQVVDGQQWDLTLRDNSGATTAGITGRPRIGADVTIVDMGGLIGTVGLAYAAKVIETGYDAAPKQAGEFNLTVENLVLIESQTGA